MRWAGGSEALRRAQGELTRLNEQSQVLTMPADVSSPDEMRHLVETTLAKRGGPGGLLANRGVYGPKGPLHEVDWVEWSKAIDVTLMGVALPCRSALPH